MHLAKIDASARFKDSFLSAVAQHLPPMNWSEMASPEVPGSIRRIKDEKGRLKSSMILRIQVWFIPLSYEVARGG